jgi:hypothetical protein
MAGVNVIGKGGIDVKKDSKKSCQVNERETGWGGFLIDENAVAALPFLDRAIETTARLDQDIVREAWKKRRTIVTSNRRDFLHYIDEFQSPPNNPTCRDLWGLLILPDMQLVRKKGLESIRHGLNVKGRESLRWPGAGLLNLYVRLTANARTEIRRFKRCPFCEHPQIGIEISTPWNDWYHSLPLVGER